MIVNNHNNIESDTLYSFLLCKVEQPNLTDLIEISNNMLALYGEENDKTLYPTEYFFLKEISSELSERMECITKSADKINEQDLMNCEEITIVDYGCGQGLASLSMLDWLYQCNGNLNNIKTVKLVDKDSNALSRALLHFSVLFPMVEVIAYDQDFLDKSFSVDCNSVLTINLFSHVFNAKTCYADRIKDIILNGHNLFMHNIIIEDISSNGDIVRDRQNFCDYLSCSIEDYTGCKSIVDFEYMLKSDKNEKNVVRHCVLSRTNIDSISIPKVNNNFSFLCPGDPDRKMINVPSRILWYDCPLEGSEYVKQLDDESKISLEKDYLSTSFENNEYFSEEFNPHTIKNCAEQFRQTLICHAISCGLPCGQEIVSLYEKAASDGLTEAYNNLGILQFQLAGHDDANEKRMIKKGIRYFKLAAEGGASSAMMNLASYYMSDGKEKEAFEYYKKAAELKETNGLFNLAVIYNFGLINQEINLKKAEELYRLCIDEINRNKDFENRDYHVQCSCCLNLMLMMWKRGEHYLDLLTVYNLAKKPSDELRYCKEILQIIFTRRFSKDVKDILFLKDAKADEKPFIKYNCAIFLYNGLLLKSFNVKIEKDKETAFSIVKSLVETEDEFNVWTNKEKYVFPIYAKWLHSDKKGSGGLDEKYWRKAARADKDNVCAYMTNIAICAEMSDDEKKSIWERFAFADGCKSCHECSNYDTLLRLCPKAQYKWAREYESDKDFSISLIRKSANQLYEEALFYLGFKQAIKEELPTFREESKFIPYLRTTPPKQYEKLYPILAKDSYFFYLQSAAKADMSISRSILPFVAKHRNDKYNFIYWTCVYYAKRNNEEMKLCILDFLKEKCNKSLDSYFKPKTLCEREMLSYAESFAKSTKNITFICELAKFYLQGDSLYKARELYLIAKEKGCKNLDEILGNINSRIEDIEKEERRKSYRSYDYYDEPDYMRDSWDAMTDGMYGDMPDGFDGDYDFLGY